MGSKSVLVFAFVVVVAGFAHAQTEVKIKSRTAVSSAAASNESIAPTTVPVQRQDDSEGDDDRPSHAPYNRVPSTLETSLYLELLGRNVGYSLGVEKPLTAYNTLGLALSYVGGTNGAYNWSSSILHPYFTAYSGTRHRLLGTLGLLLMYTSGSYSTTNYSLDTNGNLQTTGSGIQHVSGWDYAPEVGGGYEFRSIGGFIFRATVYLFFIHSYAGLSAQVLPWAGLTLGFTI